MDARDRIILEHAPLVAVPKYGALDPIEVNRHRFLVSGWGVHLEARRPWLHVCVDLLDEPINLAMELPYGDLDLQNVPGLELAFDWKRDAIPLIERFAAEADTHSPAEHAAWILWNDDKQALEYWRLEITSRSAGGVQYQRPDLPPHRSLAIDLHSHGSLPAYFSDTDDTDDAGAVKIAGVIGDLNGERSTTFRLCLLGLFRDLDLSDVA